MDDEGRKAAASAGRRGLPEQLAQGRGSLAKGMFSFGQKNIATHIGELRYWNAETIRWWSLTEWIFVSVYKKFANHLRLSNMIETIDFKTEKSW